MDIVAFDLLPDYKIALTFANGEQKQFDMKPLFAMKPWNRLLENNLYQQARIDYGTLVWGDSIDIAPETLYLDSNTITNDGQALLNLIQSSRFNQLPATCSTELDQRIQEQRNAWED